MPASLASCTLPLEIPPRSRLKAQALLPAAPLGSARRRPAAARRTSTSAPAAGSVPERNTMYDPIAAPERRPVEPHRRPAARPGTARGRSVERAGGAVGSGVRLAPPAQARKELVGEGAVAVRWKGGDPARLMVQAAGSTPPFGSAVRPPCAKVPKSVLFAERPCSRTDSPGLPGAVCQSRLVPAERQCGAGGMKAAGAGPHLSSASPRSPPSSLCPRVRGCGSGTRSDRRPGLSCRSL